MARFNAAVERVDYTFWFNRDHATVEQLVLALERCNCSSCCYLATELAEAYAAIQPDKPGPSAAC